MDATAPAVKLTPKAAAMLVALDAFGWEAQSHPDIHTGAVRASLENKGLIEWLDERNAEGRRGFVLTAAGKTVLTGLGR